MLSNYCIVLSFYISVYNIYICYVFKEHYTYILLKYKESEVTCLFILCYTDIVINDAFHKNNYIFIVRFL